MKCDKCGKEGQWIELVNGEKVCEKCYNLIQDEIKKVNEKLQDSR